MRTVFANAATVRRDWYVVDATDKTLGRLASQVASRLRGKHKAAYTPNVDTGDHIVIINAGKIRVTGRKMTDKFYHHHTGYLGNLKTTSLEKLLDEHPERAIQFAVKGMLPKNPLGRKMFKKLHVFSGRRASACGPAAESARDLIRTTGTVNHGDFDQLRHWPTQDLNGPRVSAQGQRQHPHQRAVAR